MQVHPDLPGLHRMEVNVFDPVGEGVLARWSKWPQRGWIKLVRKARFPWIKLVRNSSTKWIKLVRISPRRVDQAGENDWIMLAGNDTPEWTRPHFTHHRTHLMEK